MKENVRLSTYKYPGLSSKICTSESKQVTSLAHGRRQFADRFAAESLWYTGLGFSHCLGSEEI